MIGGAAMAFTAIALVALAVSGGELGLGLGQKAAETASTGLGRALIAALGVMLFIADAVLVLRVMGFGGSKIIEFESEAGRMIVDVTALEECLRRTALEDSDVTDSSASIMIPRGGINKTIECNLDVGLLERADIPGKGSELASRIRRRFLQIIPIDRDPVVNLQIRIRAPKQGSPATQAMTPAAGLEAVAVQEEKEPEPLPDVPEFTGERRYAVQDEEESSS
jgi:hypothetical protein